MRLSRLAKILLTTQFFISANSARLISPVNDQKNILSENFAIFTPKTIILDPGHGGKDTGYKDRHTNTPEKEINLNIAKYLKLLLEEQGYKVIMTRTTDSEVNIRKVDYDGNGKVNIHDELPARKDMIKNLGADYFISLHNNADKFSRWTNGLEIWTYGYRHKKEITNRKADYHTPERSRYKNEEAFKFGKNIEKTFSKAGFKTKIACGDFGILENNPIQKAIIIEYGYLTNKDDRKRMESPDFQKYCAEITAKYFKENETPWKD